MREFRVDNKLRDLESKRVLVSACKMEKLSKKKGVRERVYECLQNLEIERRGRGCEYFQHLEIEKKGESL